MSEEKTKSLNPVTVGFLLLLSIVVIVVAIVAMNILFQAKLKQLALDVRKANNAATVSKEDLSRLKNLRSYLEKEKDTIDKTKKIVADSSSYQYQDQVINDISNYSTRSGVVVTGVNFDEQVNNSGTAGNSAIPNPTPTNGAKFATATINIKSPVNYRNAMQFLYYLENNLTKLQVTSVSMSKASKAGQEVTINPLTLKVYIK